MKYPNRYEDRLVAWHDLRSSALTDESFLLEVNDFWQFAPEVKPMFDWREPQNWPDPWDLIREDDQSDIARALGIVYTIILSCRSNLVESTMLSLYSDTAVLETNLVIVDQGKYVLNWTPREIVNINLQQLSVIRSIPAVELVSRIR